MAQPAPAGPFALFSTAIIIASVLLQSCGGGSGVSGGGGGGNPPPAPTGLTATAGTEQVSLAWTASAGASSYNVKRGTAHNGPYTTIASPAATSYVNTGVTAGTTYYYVVTAGNANGESSPSGEASAAATAPVTNVSVTVDVLTNRRAISPYIYGGSYPKDAATVTDSGLSIVRWGGNATSTYNWQLFTYNADADYFFEDFGANGFGNNSGGDSVQWIKDVIAAKSTPLMTMSMLPWVAKSSEVAGTGGNGHWSFSINKYGAQCASDQYNNDAGNGTVSGCGTGNSVYVTGNDPNDAYFPLLDDHTQTCPSGTTCLYRNDWAAALATAFGSAPHFYDMDNEIDIWNGTHRDIHPSPATYNELRDVFLTESRNLKNWDPQAVRFGPVSCCWFFYWRSAAGASDTSSHGGVDFLPWWLNEVAWSDTVAGTRSLDVFDIHAYPDADTNGLSTAQRQALAASIYRDWWDPSFPSAAAYIRGGGFSIEPLDSKPFRIPRMRAVLNQTYPGTQFSITEWSAAFAGESDFSTALGDADAYGILGRERAYLASRWGAPDPANPNYLALKLYTNYDGSHHGFGSVSVSDTNTGDPNLFSSYAALDSTGNTMTVMVLNKDPQSTAQVQFTTNGFTPSSVTAYTLSAAAPATITQTTPAWSSTMNFAPYTATLLVISGATNTRPSSEWDLNPDTIMLPAGGTVTLHPKVVSGTANITLSTQTSDPGISVSLTQPNITTAQNATVTVTAGNTPGFYYYTVTGTDGTATQTQGGWIVVGNPPATMAKTGGDGQTGGTGSTLPQALTVTLSPGNSGGSASGASILFSTSAGSLSNGTTSGSKVIAVTNSSGVASVTLTLPGTAQGVHVQAEAPFALGNAAVTFNETVQ